MNKYLVSIFCFWLMSMAAIAKDYGIREKQGAYIPDDVWVFQQEDHKQRLTQLIDKPTLITFSYYHCSGKCPDLHEGIAEIIQQTDSVLGIDYQVITISIDTSDMIEYGLQMKDSLVKKYNIPEAQDAWKIFLTDNKSLQNLTETIGYSFQSNVNDFVHPMVSVMVTPDGMVSQYLYGTFFLPWHIQQAISIANKEQTSASRIKTIKYCYNYEPQENTIVRQIAIASGISILALVILLFVYLMVTRRKNKYNQ